jgi:hypothetical protein
MTEGNLHTLFNFPEAIEVELGGYLSACDIASFLLCSKKALQYDKPVIWRQLLSIRNDESKHNPRGKKHKKKSLSKKSYNADFFRDTFISTWKAIINERRKHFLGALLSSYDADMKRSIHRECIRTALAATKSNVLVVNQRQTVCKHNHLLLIHGKTIYPTSGHTSDSRELVLNKSCYGCSSTCYDKVIFCACCNDASDYSSNSFCVRCVEAQKFTGHHNHPKIEFSCPRDYYLEKEYTVGCFDCGLAFVARITSNYKLRWQKPCLNGASFGGHNKHLATAEFVCPSRQNVFRNMLLNHEGKVELLFRMKTGDMLFDHSDEALAT